MMRKEVQEYQQIKEYLLGIADSEESRELVEKKLMADGNYYENLQSIEEELIQNYADEKLSPDEKNAFETHFLISDDRRDKVKFAYKFRDHINSLSLSKAPAPKKIFDLGWIFSFPVLRLGSGSVSALQLTGALAVTVLVLFSSIVLWNRYSDYATLAQGKALLEKAYVNGGPLDSQISQINYPPPPRLRGKPTDEESLARERASDLIRKAADENPTAMNLGLLAQLYLTDKKFDKAILRLQQALKLDPNNPDLYNDLGVAYLEKALVEDDSDPKILGNALENFNKAVAIKPDLKASLFNRARCLEASHLYHEARKAWQEYLKYDATSDWAKEAEKHVKNLDSKISSKTRQSDKRQDDFLDAVKKNDREEAFRLASQNRELITENYLPQKLAMSLLKAEGDQKTEIHKALKYLGEIEKEKNQDNFAADLATFYANLPEEKAATLREAQKAILEGYFLCLTNKYDQATQKFSESRQLFLKAGDVIEANTISSYFITYGLYFSKPPGKGAVELFRQVDEFSVQRNYRWFALMNREWVIGSQVFLGDLLPAEADNLYQLALQESEDINDAYMRQKFLCSLVERDLSVRKQDESTFAYLKKIFEYFRETNVSSRQKERGFDAAIAALAITHLTALPQAIVQESIEFHKNTDDNGDENADRLFVIRTLKNAGIVYTQAGYLPEGEKWLNEAKTSAEDLGQGIQRQNALAGILLELGNLESKKKDYDRAVQYYDNSLQIQQEIIDNEYQQTQQQVKPSKLLYDTKKARLLAYEVLGDNAKITLALPDILNIIEDKRTRITSEQERNTFFNYEQEVYDVAIGHAFREGNPEQAFNYAEVSNSRSLLGQLQNGSYTPIDLAQIQERIPANVQLLQYAVLKDRVLIWTISRDKFNLDSSEITSDALKGKVEQYLSKVSSRERSQQEQAPALAQELYNLLITPVSQRLDKDRDIFIIPNKILFNLPFSALLSPSRNYLLQEYSFSYSPSANVFVVSTQEAQDRGRSGSENLLSVGNPKFDKEQLTTLEDLPESAAEAEDIAQYYPPRSNAKVLVNGAATKSAFQRYMESSDVIHFAGHYLVHPEAPLLSELVMAKSSNKEEDNFFTNSELRAQRLPRTRLVVLSACQTGVEGYYNGEGLVGLSRTFLALRVPLVVASKWRVDSDATAELMKKFHQYRKQEKISTVKALRKAQLEMVNAADEKLRAPYYWASFAAFGGYAEF